VALAVLAATPTDFMRRQRASQFHTSVDASAFTATPLRKNGSRILSGPITRPNSRKAKKRNEGAKNHHAAREQIVQAHPQKISAVDKQLHRFFDYVEAEHQYSIK
jgi:hypothetical protein